MRLEAQAQREGVENITGASGAVVGLLLLFIHKGDVTNSSTEERQREQKTRRRTKRAFRGFIEICRVALDGSNFSRSEGPPPRKYSSKDTCADSKLVGGSIQISI